VSRGDPVRGGPAVRGAGAVRTARACGAADARRRRRRGARLLRGRARVSLFRASWSLGNTDAASIAYHLAAFYAADAAREGAGVIFDIGANRGDTTQVLISALVPAFACVRYYSLAAAPGAACPKWFGALFAVEANPPTADALAARAAFERWDLLDFVLVREAFTDAAGGVARFAARAAGDEVASLTVRPPAGAPDAVDVPLGSVDALRAARGEAARRIFLLKIDAEGFDVRVIKGAEASFAEPLAAARPRHGPHTFFTLTRAVPTTASLPPNQTSKTSGCPSTGAAASRKTTHATLHSAGAAPRSQSRVGERSGAAARCRMTVGSAPERIAYSAW